MGPGGSPYPELPPLKLFGQQAEFQGALNAAMAVSAACLDRMTTGAGQAIEVSEQECMTAILEGTLVQYTYAGREASRLGQYAYGPRAIFPCADGWLHINLAEEAQWQRLVERMGNPDWTREEIFRDRLLKGANRDALEPLLAAWTAPDVQPVERGQAQYPTRFSQAASGRHHLCTGAAMRRGSGKFLARRNCPRGFRL